MTTEQLWALSDSDFNKWRRACLRNCCNCFKYPSNNCNEYLLTWILHRRENFFPKSGLEYARQYNNKELGRLF